METQGLFNIAVACAGAFGGFLIKSILDSVKELKRTDEVLHKRVTELASDLPATYLRRDDFMQYLTRMEKTLERIEKKIDEKADKK
ncbi:MAG TPA: hypothetical protein DEP47_05525 [Chloroflexi bacterium]|nr:hypothetical protein [Chloroflexota bacterium]